MMTSRNTYTFDWYNITKLAYLTLIEFESDELPIPPKKIKCKNVIITSYQKYAEKTGKSINEISQNGLLPDAYLHRNIRPGLIMILYNKEIYGPRMKHSILHEVGHIKCNHLKHGEKEEIEADFFAAQINAPNILIKELSNRGYSISIQLLMDCFGLSKKSAKLKKEYLEKYGFYHRNEYDDLIQLKFKIFLDKKYPKPISRNDDYFDDLDKERENW